jgi:hypothetical protein
MLQVGKPLSSQWLPLKRGTLNPVPPFLRGVRGDLKRFDTEKRTFQTSSKTKKGEPKKFALIIMLLLNPN